MEQESLKLAYSNLATDVLASKTELDAKLEKIAVGGCFLMLCLADRLTFSIPGVRNFPRNLHMSSRNLASMGVSRPPYIQTQRFQAASAWTRSVTSRCFAP